MKITVELDEHDLAIADRGATARSDDVIRHNRVDRVPSLSKHTIPERSRIGSRGEAAFAKGLQVKEWLPLVNTFQSLGDVGNAEVRTRTESWHDLQIRKTDPPDRPYVLVIAEPDFKRFHILGWIVGHEAMTHDEWFKDVGGYNKPCYWVPQDKLSQDWHTLQELMKR